MIRLALALVLAAAPLSGAGAQGLGPAGELAGSYRNLFAVTRDSRDKVILTDFNRLRLSLQGVAGAWSWRITYDHELAAGGFVESPDFAPVEAIPEPTALDATDAIAGGERFEWRQRLYRAVLAYDWGGGQLSVGRQRIAWGSGRLWNPTDRFNPVAPTAIGIVVVVFSSLVSSEPSTESCGKSSPVGAVMVMAKTVPARVTLAVIGLP